MAAADDSCQMLSTKLMAVMVGNVAVEETPLGKVSRHQLFGDSCCLHSSVGVLERDSFRFRTSWIVFGNRGHEESHMCILEVSRDLQLVTHDMHVKAAECKGEEFQTGDILIQLFSEKPVIVSDVSSINFALSAAASRPKPDSVYRSEVTGTIQHGTPCPVGEPWRANSSQLVLDNQEASLPEEGTGECHAAGVLGGCGNHSASDVGASSRRTCASSQSGTMSSPSELPCERRESAWQVEEVLHVREEALVHQVGSREPTLEFSEDREGQEESDPSDICLHRVDGSLEFGRSADGLGCAGHHAATDRVHGSEHCVVVVSGDDAYDAGNTADGSDSGAAPDHHPESAAHAESSHGSAGTAAAAGSSSSGDIEHRLGRRDGGSLDGCQSEAVRAVMSSFTSELSNGAGNFCADQPVHFIGRLTIPLMNFLLTNDHVGFWAVGCVDHELVVFLSSFELRDRFMHDD